MAVGQSERRVLQEALVQTLGPDAADALMDHLPPVGWADVATKHDLDQHAAATERDLDRLAAATHARFDQMEASTNARFDQMEASTNAHFGQVDARFDRIEDRLEQLHKDQLALFFRLVMVMIALLGAMTAISQLG